MIFRLLDYSGYILFQKSHQYEEVMKYVKLFFLVILLVGCSEADRGKAFITSQEGGITVIDLN